MTSRLHLGKTTFVTTNGPILLSSEATVEVSPCKLNICDQDFSVLSFSSSQGWIKAGASFNIFFSISIDDLVLPKAHSRQAFCRHLAHILANAELWSQLELQAHVGPIRLESTTYTNQLCTLQLGLRREDGWPGPQRTGIRNVYTVPDANDLRPPDAIPNTALHSIGIFLSFSCTDAPMIGARKRYWWESDPVTDLATQALKKHHFLVHAVVQGDEHEMATAPAHANCFSTCKGECGTRSLPSSPCEPLLMEEYEPVDARRNNKSENVVYSSQGSTLSRAPWSSATLISEPSSSPDPSLLTSLTDMALRTLICETPMRPNTNISLKCSTLDGRLSDVLPTMFIPGYERAIASRAPLIPVVARSLTSFLQRSRARDVDIRHPISLQQLNGDTETIVDARASLHEALQGHLWISLTNSLRNTEPARRLKPLRFSVEARNDHSDDLFALEDRAAHTCSQPEPSHEEDEWKKERGSEIDEVLELQGRNLKHHSPRCVFSNAGEVVGRRQETVHKEPTDDQSTSPSQSDAYFEQLLSWAEAERKEASSLKMLSYLEGAVHEQIPGKSRAIHFMQSSPPLPRPSKNSDDTDDNSASMLLEHAEHHECTASPYAVQGQVHLATSPSMLLLETEQDHEDKEGCNSHDTQVVDEAPTEASFDQWEFDVEQGYDQDYYYYRDDDVSSMLME